MDIGTRLLTYFKGRLVGTDTAGNRYFIEREPRGAGAALRRWVLYQGANDPATLPAGWRAWLHFATGGPVAGDGDAQSWSPTAPPPPEPSPAVVRHDPPTGRTPQP